MPITKDELTIVSSGDWCAQDGEPCYYDRNAALITGMRTPPVWVHDFPSPPSPIYRIGGRRVARWRLACSMSIGQAMTLWPFTGHPVALPAWHYDGVLADSGLCLHHPAAPEEGLHHRARRPQVPDLRRPVPGLRQHRPPLPGLPGLAGAPRAVPRRLGRPAGPALTGGRQATNPAQPRSRRHHRTPDVQNHRGFQDARQARLPPAPLGTGRGQP